MKKKKSNYKHTANFYNNKYAEYKRGVKAIGGTALNKNAFIEAYEYKQGQKKPIIKELIYDSKYGTKLKTAKAELKALKDIGISANLEDLKSMTTQDFADVYAKEIAKSFNDYRAAGKSLNDTYDLISQMWFGSN